MNYCFSCLVSPEDMAGSYSTIAIDERDGAGDESTMTRYDAGSQPRKVEKLTEEKGLRVGKSGRSCFWVTLERESTKASWGLALDPDPPGMEALAAIYVCSVAGGKTPASEANEQRPAGEQLMPGDFVTSVNGAASDIMAMVHEFENSRKLELYVRRPVEFSLPVCKNECLSVGCDLHFDTRIGTTLVIQAINEGLIKAWNASNPSKAVLEGDRIAAVNGQRGTAEQLLDRIRISDELNFVLQRPAAAAVM